MAAAATAVLFSVALPTAPAARAEQSGGPAPHAPSVPPGQVTASGSAPGGQSPSVPSGSTGAGGTGPETSSAPSSGTPTPPAGTPSAGTAPPGGTQTPGDGGGDGGGTGTAPWCWEIDQEYRQTAVRADIVGLPAQITAGSGWHSFTVRISNTSDRAVTRIDFYAEVENYAVDADRWLSPYIELQYRSPDGDWTRLGTREFAGGYFGGAEALPKHSYIDTAMRLNVTAQAPLGDGYALSAGDFLTEVRGEPCIATGESYHDFVVLAPGSGSADGGASASGGSTSEGGGGTGSGTAGSPGSPGSPASGGGATGATGGTADSGGPGHAGGTDGAAGTDGASSAGDRGNPDGGDRSRDRLPLPLDDPENLPVTGSLAGTGASGPLLVLAGAGAAAMTAGAAALAVARRRRRGQASGQHAAG